MDTFRQDLLEHISDFEQALSTHEGDWTVKGFIDVYKNIYTISGDTKVVSKIVELMLFPLISKTKDQSTLPSMERLKSQTCFRLALTQDHKRHSYHL